MDQHQKTNERDVSKLDTSPGSIPEDPGAAAAAEQEAIARAEPDAGASVHRLSRPLQWEGRTYEALTFRWDALTGVDHMEIENGLLMRGKTLVVSEYTSDYLCGMAVRACTERDEKGNRALTAAALKVLPPGRLPGHLRGGPKFFIPRAPKGQTVGQWLREQCLILARNNCTPVDYWLSLPLKELELWIKANNAVVKDARKGE